jgi:hypothetical protein
MGSLRWARRLLAIVRTFLATLFRSDEQRASSAAPTAPVDLGELPDELRIRWPAAPDIRREVVIRSPLRLGDRWKESGTRLRVETDLDWLILDADDLEIVVAKGVRIGRVLIAQGRKRIRFVGGTYGQIEVQIPIRFLPPPAQWREDWMVEDVLFDCVRVESKGESGLLLRGRRIAILHSMVKSRRFAIWCGDTKRFRNEDVIIARSRLESGEGAATVRLSDVLRAVVVQSRLSTTESACREVHGRCDGVFARRNLLVGGGLAMGSAEEDAIGTAWFVDNAVFCGSREPFALGEERIRRLVLTGNEVSSERGLGLWPDALPHGWTVEDNGVSGWQPRELA